jgi:UDP-N-acetylglucosamine--N-acetylmuramyl-(pentapeptide) pyrophosphoryl-undecaprenol N-acetylglucosamine transferase
MLERGLTRQDLTAALQRLLTTPGRLEAMAAAARSLARPDAAERLADIVEATAG